MVKLYETGAYLLNGSELVPDDGQAQAVLASKGVQTSKELSLIHISEPTRP